MQRITRDNARAYEFSKDISPKLHVKPGESFVLETEDAATGRIRTPDFISSPETRPELKATPARVNPLAGPVYVEGAEPGDLLVANIERIDVDTQGWTGCRTGMGPLGDSIKWAEASTPYTHIMEHVPGPSGTLRDGRVIYSDRFSWDLQPFIGTIGCAPEREVESSIIGQGPWGGNLDCREFREDSKVFMNCYHEGALFFLGDVHGSQGDTEFTGTANETRAEVTVSLELIKKQRIPFLRVEKADSIVSIYADKPLEDAVHNAIVGLMEWMVEEYAVSKRDAYLLMSVCPDVRVHVYQMVKIGRINFVAGAEIPKKHLT